MLILILIIYLLGVVPMNTCILEEILYKYYKPYRKYADKRNIELMKGKNNNVG